MSFYSSPPPRRPTDPSYRRGFNTTLGVLAALFVVFVLVPLAGCVGCMMLANMAPEPAPRPHHSLTYSPTPESTWLP